MSGEGFLALLLFGYIVGLCVSLCVVDKNR